MKRILWIVGLLALVGCADSVTGPEGAVGETGPAGVPGGVLWRDAEDRVVGYGGRLGVGYFDEVGRLWTVNPLTGQPDQGEIRGLLYETPDCTGEAWETTALALVPVRYQDGYSVRPVEARMAVIFYGSEQDSDGTCVEGTGASVSATAFADFEHLGAVPQAAVFTPPLYPVRPVPPID